MSQQFPAEGDGRMEGQRRGSAMVLNDYTGLKLLGRGQTGNGWPNDSEAKNRERRVPADVGVDCCISIKYAALGL